MIKMPVFIAAVVVLYITYIVFLAFWLCGVLFSGRVWLMDFSSLFRFLYNMLDLKKFQIFAFQPFLNPKSYVIVHYYRLQGGKDVNNID